ncbi:zinc finger protein 850-like [Hoplias malabaricus]|uniref:zinc finger protein 850-like n=1 Tax=Hoplias malabaricus TaxID=27720 RepID=UPI003462520E
MLEIQETKSASKPSSKTYSCVACSATFNCLSPLLVHQASHTSESSDQKAAILPSSSHCSGLSVNSELLINHHCMAFSPLVTEDLNKCDPCQDLTECNSIQEAHIIETQVEPQLDKTSKIISETIETDERNKTSNPCRDSDLVEMNCSHSDQDTIHSDEILPSHCTDEPLHLNLDANSENKISTPDKSAVNITFPQEHHDEGLQPSKSPTEDFTGCCAIQESHEIETQVEPQLDKMNNDDSKYNETSGLASVSELAEIDFIHSDKAKINSETSDAMLEAYTCTSDLLPVPSTISQERHDERTHASESPSEALDITEITATLDAQETETQIEPQLDKMSNEISEINETSEVAEMDCSHSDYQPKPPSRCTDKPIHQNPDAVSEDYKSTSDLVPIHDTISQDDQDHEERPQASKSPTDECFEDEIENLKFQTVSDSEELTGESKDSMKDNSLMKMLASAYMSRKHPAQMQYDHSQRNLPPQKVSPSPQIQTPAFRSASNSRYFINQLRQKVAKFGLRREGFRYSRNILNVKPIKKKKKKWILSTTKTLYPVVAIETYQKLDRDNTEGKHQCGVCRRVFQDVDSLVMHHVLHKKERVKFCRRCRQYVIFVISVPNNHICSSFNAGTLSNSPAIQHPRKLFHCTLCNRSYTRRYRLKRHNCQGIASLKQSATGAESDDDKISYFEESTSSEKHFDLVNFEVNTGEFKQIKNEDLDESPFEENYQKTKHPSLTAGVRLSSAESFPPFHSNNSLQDQRYDTEASESLSDSQWTVPLDDAEVDIDNYKRHLVDSRKESADEVLDFEPNITHDTGSMSDLSNTDFHMYVSASGVKRFSCSKCHKSYSRRSRVRQHLTICGAQDFTEQDSNILAIKKMFPCPNCGRSFTRKYRMNIHRSKCPMRNSNTMEKSHENLFVLPPFSNQEVTQEDSSSNSGSGSWGLMSLPSVLPRKVTCDCGAAFTCPKRLFEHLQMHALESYICSFCGETLPSWAAFEAHQKVHAQSVQKESTPQQPHVQSQLQQVPHFQQSKQNQKYQAQGMLRSKVNYKRHSQPSVCPRCKKVFGWRKSMLRHLRLSCRGDTAVQKEYSCSRCGMMFQSQLKHKVHIQSNNCTPSFKPIRCPVCVRWFTCVDRLKSHLVSHSQQTVFMCQICGHKCSSDEDLKEHKAVHGLKEVAESPTIQSAQVSQSNPSEAFQCQICQRSYPKLQSLKDHVRKVHRPPSLNPVSGGTSGPKAGEPWSSGVQQGQSNQFQCNVCSRTYPDIRSLKNHKRRVHRILSGFQPTNGTVQQSYSSPFQCHICSRTYPDIGSLKNHKRRVHRILSGFEPSEGTVQQSNSSQFQCNICSRTYPDIRSLKNHKRRVHRILSGFEPSKGTVQQGCSSPFQCNICSRTYPDLRSLRNHRRRVHRILGGLEDSKGPDFQSQDNPYTCQMCHRSYPDVRSLKNHRRRVHRILGDVPETANVASTHVELSEIKSEPLDDT